MNTLKKDMTEVMNYTFLARNSLRKMKSSIQSETGGNSYDFVVNQMQHALHDVDAWIVETADEIGIDIE